MKIKNNIILIILCLTISFLFISTISASNINSIDSSENNLSQNITNNNISGLVSTLNNEKPDNFSGSVNTRSYVKSDNIYNTDSTNNQNHQFTANSNVNKSESHINMDLTGAKNQVKTVLIGKSIVVTAILTEEDATGNVTFVKHADNFNEEKQTVDIINGRATITIPVTNTRHYAVYARYNGNEKYNPSYTPVSLIIYGLKTETKIDFNMINDEIIINLTDINNKPIKYGFITYTINDTKDYGTGRTDENGILKVNDKYGIMNFTAKYLGDNIYSGSTKSIDIIINKIYPEKITTTINSADFRQTAVDFHNKEYGNYFTVTLKDATGKILPGKNISIGLNNVIYNRTTDENGTSKLQINLKYAGIYTFATTFLGDDYCEGSFAVNKITILKKPTKITLKGNNQGHINSIITLTVHLTGKNSLNSTYRNGINKKIELTINGKTYTSTTNKHGIATFKIKINRTGTYTITTKFLDDGTYSSKTLNSKITIRK